MTDKVPTNSQQDNAGVPLKRYLFWLAIPLLMFAVALFMPGKGPDEPIKKNSKKLRLQDKKFNRVLRFFEMTSADSKNVPLYTVNQPGLKIDLALDPETFRLMLIKENRKRFKRRSTNMALRFADGRPRTGIISLRGAGTLEYNDKLSFNIELSEAEAFSQHIKIKRFYLINMVSDLHEINLVFSYSVLSDLGLFVPHFQYVRVAVNGEPQGMYLLIEQPKAAIRRVFPNTVAIYRRQGRNKFKTLLSKAVPDVNAPLRRLTNANDQMEITNPLETYNAALDLEVYFSWLGINSLLMNEDSLDGLFLYEVRGEHTRPQPLHIMGWDYDRIMAAKPKKDSVEDTLMFSAKDAIDFNIFRHSEMYTRYRKSLFELLSKRLSSERLVTKLRKIHEMRKRLDDGLPPDDQALRSQARAVAVAEIETRLRDRHAELLNLLK